MTTDRRRRLVCVGSVVVDIAMHVTDFPEPGGDVVAESAMVTVGGAFNVMSAARRQGLPVIYLAGHGTGPFGDMVRSSLRGIEIDIAADAVLTRDTGFCVTFVTANGERTFATASGAEAIATCESLGAVQVSSDDLVYVSGYGLASPDSGPAIARWVSRLNADVLVVVDPGPLIAAIPDLVLREVAERCNWWTCNEREARLMTAAANSYQAIRALAETVGRDGVLVRLGGNGCLLLVGGSDVQHVAGRSVEVVDTTGAGDAHTATFLAALADGAEPAEAVHRANVAASIAVTQYGPATAPTAEELRRTLPGAPPNVMSVNITDVHGGL